MVKSKKLLSLFLAVVMTLSVFTVMASAYTVGPEVAGAMNFKYTVEKVDTVPETAAGSAEYTADNIYAVTAWMKSSRAVITVTIPFHFNKALFSPIMLFDGEATYPYGAGFGVDDYYTTMEEGAVYAYSLGDYMNNTGMYKADGSKATTKALAKCIGLGNSNSEGVTVTTELVSPDHPLYNKWGAGLPADTGVMYAYLEVTGKTKTAYLNTVSGIETEDEWFRMFTVYFEAIADDVTGAEFGVYTDDCFTVDGASDDAGYGYFVNATTAKVGNPDKNVVSNAVVEEAAEPSPVYAKSTQIRFNGPETDGKGSADFDIRTRAAMTAADFAAICGSDPEAIAAAEAGTLEVGFIYAATSNVANFDKATAEAVINGGTASGYAKKVVEHIQKTDSEYIWTCLINDGPDYSDGVSAVGYVKDGDQVYIFDDVKTTSFTALYDAASDAGRIPQA